MVCKIGIPDSLTPAYLAVESREPWVYSSERFVWRWLDYALDPCCPILWVQMEVGCQALRVFCIGSAPASYWREGERAVTIR